MSWVFPLDKMVTVHLSRLFPRTLEVWLTLIEARVGLRGWMNPDSEPARVFKHVFMSTKTMGKALERAGKAAFR